MLKIKDNVDLKELEKFGFSLNKKGTGYKKYIDYLGYEIVYTVDLKTRIITIWLGDAAAFKLDSTMYDLTKANLVEKVDE